MEAEREKGRSGVEQGREGRREREEGRSGVEQGREGGRERGREEWSETREGKRER